MRETNTRLDFYYRYPLFGKLESAVKCIRLRSYICIIAISICLSVVLSLAAGSFLSRAQTGRAEVSYKYFTSILVMPGDTLTSIAGRYADTHYTSVEAYIEEIRMTNHLREDEIHAGSYLIVPYFSSEVR